MSISIPNFIPTTADHRATLAGTSRTIFPVQRHRSTPAGTIRTVGSDHPDLRGHQPDPADCHREGLDVRVDRCFCFCGRLPLLSTVSGNLQEVHALSPRPTHDVPNPTADETRSGKVEWPDRATRPHLLGDRPTPASRLGAHAPPAGRSPVHLRRPRLLALPLLRRRARGRRGQSLSIVSARCVALACGDRAKHRAIHDVTRCLFLDYGQWAAHCR